MLIASVSDIHTDFPANRDAVVRLATEIHDRGADAVIVAGDISHKNDRIDRGLRAFRAVTETVAFVPGNHDLWFDVPNASQDASLDTWHRYHVELKDLAETAGVHYLPAAPLVLDSVAIVGSCGWYDYSLALPSVRASVGEETLKKKEMGGVRWSDLRFIAFRDQDGGLMDDPAVARAMERSFEAHLVAMQSAPNIQEIIAVTHHLPYAEVVSRTGTLPWEFFNAYMGSQGLGEIMSRCDKVKTAIYGHTHIVAEHDIQGIRVYGTPLGYPRERGGLSDADVVGTRIGWVEC